MTLMCTFRSVTDLCEWSETNMMPRLKMDGRNKKGEKVASGIYMVETATNEGNQGTVCKIAIIR